MHKRFRRTVIFFVLFLFLFMHVPWTAEAGGLEITGDEFSDYYRGVFPTVITFADTAACDSPADYASVLSKLSGPGVQSPNAHYFTAHPGERFQFTLSSSASVMKSLLRIDKTDSGVLTEQGSYAVYWQRQYLEVTDFGFDSDLSDCSGNVVLVMKGYGIQISDKREIDRENERMDLARSPAAVDFKEHWSEAVPIEVRAGGTAGLIPVDDLQYYYKGYTDYTEGLESPYGNTVGFEFELQPSSAWEVTVAGSPTSFLSRPLLCHGQDVYTEGFYEKQEYVTPVIVLIDSDLHPRDSLPVKDADFPGFEQKNEEELEKRDLEAEIRREEERKTAASNQESHAQGQTGKASLRKRKYDLTTGSLTYPTKNAAARIPAAIVLAALSAGASALLAAASGSFRAPVKAEEKSDEETTAECTITVNDGRDLPFLLAGSEHPVSIAIQLTGAEENLVLWTAAVLPDPDQDLQKRLASLHVSCAGDNLSARLVMQCESVPEEFHATIRISASGVRSKTRLASAVCNVTVKNAGIYERKEKGKTSVVEIREGAIRGTAEEIVLKEGEYTRREENGTVRYERKEGTDHENA